MATKPKAAEAAEAAMAASMDEAASEQPKAPATPSVEEMLAVIESMKAEIEKMKAVQGTEDAAAKAEERAKILAERKALQEAGEELVEIRLFKDSGKYKDDVYVGCNGDRILIQRGERVKIPRKFAEILDQSDLQDAKTADLIDSKVKEFERKAKEI